MLRLILCAAAFLALGFGALLAADEKKADKDKGGKHAAKATITKVDAKKGTITVRMKDKSGKEVERVFKLTEEVRYLDSTGKVVAMDFFQNGDDVLVVEEEGQLKQVKKAGKGTGTGKEKGSGTGKKDTGEKKEEKK
jgi:uncharacterized protein YigE (DUF2233 family)